jgi:mannose-6-phosphate isomerase-like protein (cupin superfamily)
MSKTIQKGVSRWNESYNWEDVEVLAYKEDGTHFRNITRQVLFDGDPKLPCQWRYFEIGADGNSTLERHDHLHVVMIIRGSGQALLGDEIVDLNCFDVVQIPSLTWHQFRATNGEPFGFLCLVNTERDRPELPSASTLEELRRDPRIAEFIRV